MESLDEIDAINHKRSVIERKLDELRGELRELEVEYARAEAGASLPTEPGWYITADDTPARLEEDGTWHDGWGNGGPDYSPAWHPLPLKRLLPQEETE